MLAEGIIREGDKPGIHRMHTIVEDMRHYMWNRIFSEVSPVANYSLPTYAEWSMNPNKPRDRFAQFCWFLASTAGNFRMQTAGSWFPYCAKVKDIAHDLNSNYCMAMSDHENDGLVDKFSKMTRHVCKESVRVQREHVGHMPITDVVMATTVAYEPEIQIEKFKSPRLQRLQIMEEGRTVWPTGGGPPLSTIDEDVVSNRGFTTFVQGNVLHTDANLHNDIAAGVEFEREWYGLRQHARRGDFPDFGPDLPEEIPRLIPPTAPRGPPTPFPESIHDPPYPHLPHYAEVETPPFNYWPYLVFGAVLIGLAVITDDPRDFKNAIGT